MFNLKFWPIVSFMSSRLAVKNFHTDDMTCVCFSRTLLSVCRHKTIKYKCDGENIGNMTLTSQSPLMADRGK